MAEPTTALEILKLHLEKYLFQSKGTNEFEVRFGTRGVHRITKITFDEVIKKLKSLNFTSSNETGDYHMTVQNEFIDSRTGRTKMSNLRTTIRGIDIIQQYCRSDSIQEILRTTPHSVSFMTKMNVKDGETYIAPINIDDYNMRISYQTETELENKSPLVRGLLANWVDSKKVFRIIQRVSFENRDFPFRIDLSIVRMGKRNKRRQVIPVYKFEEAELFSNPEVYEVEIELVNREVGANTKFQTAEEINTNMKKLIKIILSGLQNTNYPVPYTEQDKIKNEYMELLHGKVDSDRRISPKDFCGPSSYTLEIKNVQPITEDYNVPNIRKNYTVTDKADGMRKLLYIADGGKVYLITTGMNVEFTGCIVKQASVHKTLIDGEHILHDKHGGFINLYAGFDIYYIQGKNVRDKSFVPTTEDEVKTNFRLPLLVKIISGLKPESITGKSSPIRIEYKKFYTEGVGGTIFDGCRKILENDSNELFEYETDGLIFTPIEYGVGGTKKGEASKPMKMTWEYSFKWKPSRFNTIDFLVSTQKDNSNNDKISNTFEQGTDLSGGSNIKQYKSLVLRCGFDEKKHGYMNPCKDVYEDLLPSPENIDANTEYKPVPFYPTRPYDNEAHRCDIILRQDGAGNSQMFTEGNEVFEDNMIVEFRYDINQSKLQRWIPIKVRYDKTAEYRQGIRNFGNAYHVANSNWHSIHNPITETMISTGNNIPTVEADDDVYYNRVMKSSHTRALRDFHNLFVKSILITGISNRGDDLIDYTVGKGGDFSKWIKAKLSFVFGIDISKDNIENRLDGACARFLNYRKQYKSMPYALFVHGNSSLNIRNGDALFSERGRMITKAIFGDGPKDQKVLGKGVIRQYGKGADGFQISSCQFALHYFFENTTVLTNFLRNVSECTKVGGYFVGTCFSGNRLFDALISKKQGEGIVIKDGDHKLWEVRKEYDHAEFNNDSTSLGYSIDVFQETINQYIREYLVNFDYLTRCMANFGFEVLQKDEAKKLGVQSGIGSFSELYQVMEENIKKNKKVLNDLGKANKMNGLERRISFMNNYFIFKKVHSVNASKITLDQENPTIEEVIVKPSEEKPKKKRGGPRKLKIKTDE